MWRLSILVTVFVVGLGTKSTTSEVLDPEWQNLVSAGGMHIGHGRTKRFVALNENQPNIPYQACLLPDGSAGHCRHLHHCIQNDFKTDFMKFMDYLCVIQQTAVGVCCPDSISEDKMAIVPKDKDGVAFVVDRI